MVLKLMMMKGSAERKGIDAEGYIGPNTEPCGTPNTNDDTSESILFTDTHCARPVSKTVAGPEHFQRNVHNTMSMTSTVVSPYTTP